MKNYKSHLSLIKENWILILALSSLYIYSCAIVSTVLFYQEFNLSISPYFELSDYFKILLKDLSSFGMAFFFIIIAIALYLTLNSTLKNYKDKHKLASITAFTTFILISIFTYVMPVSISKLKAEQIKSGAFLEADIALKDKTLKNISIIGGNNKVIIIYNKTTNFATVIQNSEIQWVKYKGPNKKLAGMNKNRKEMYKRSSINPLLKPDKVATPTL